MQQAIWCGVWSVHDGHCRPRAAGDNSLLLPYAVGQVEERVLVVCHTLNTSSHLPVDAQPARAQAAATGCLARPGGNPVPPGCPVIYSDLQLRALVVEVE